MYLDHTIPHKNSWQVLGGSNNDRRQFEKCIPIKKRCLFQPPIKRTLNVHQRKHRVCSLDVDIFRD